MGGSSRPSCLSAGDSSRSGGRSGVSAGLPGYCRSGIQSKDPVKYPIPSRNELSSSNRSAQWESTRRSPPASNRAAESFARASGEGRGSRQVPACGIEVALMGSGQRFREQVAAENSAATCQIFGTKHHKNASRREVSCSNPGGFRGSRSSIRLERNLHMDWCGVSPAAGSSRPVRQVKFTDNYLFERLAFEHGGV